MNLPATASYRNILKFVWPLALGMANNALMQFADRVFLAHESAAALEAVLPAGILAYLFICFFQSVVSYSGSFGAQYFGAHDVLGCRRSYHAGLWLAFLSGFVFLALIPLGNQIFDWCQHSAAVLAREKIYYSIVMSGGVFLCGAMAAQGYFTGLGLTRTVFWVNLGGNLVNVALDPLLIFGWGPVPALGMSGAALATVLSQFLQCAILIVLAHRHVPAIPAASPSPPLAPPTFRLFVRILRFGVPSGVSSVLSILSFAIFVFVTGKVGDMAFAVSNAAFSVNYLLIAPIEGFAVGASTLVGQHQGARDAKSALRVGYRVMFLAETYVLLASAAVLLFHRPILSLFATDAAAFDSAAFISLGFTLFVLMVAWQFFDAADVVLSGALKGAGDTRFVMVWMLVCSFAFWLPIVFLVYRRHPTMPALWATMVAYVVLICVGTLLRWHFGPWRRIRLV
ncbi:MAG: MATE family efflux transporter [Kiritimatiellia bacterium]